MNGPIDRLILFLTLNYPQYTARDVKLSAKPGYIVANDENLICIQRVGYPLLTEDRKHVSINQLWVDLHDYYNAHVNVIKTKSNGMVTVIEWNDERYTYDNNVNR